mmetsp:Transcript_10204/g.28505  ORF Transcript_10204/g.28505 Transcript_10204/m.28505 type:complete len:228 (+) Transcript_10204:428-1111(+)
MVTSNFTSADDFPRCTSTSLRHCTSSFSTSGDRLSPCGARRRTETLSRRRHTRGTGDLECFRSSRFVSVRTQLFSGKGVRKPREPAAKESTGGMAPRKSETAQVSVPSPPIVITRSTDFSRSSAEEKVRMLGESSFSWGCDSKSCGSRITTPWEESHATMSCRVVKTSRSPGFATRRTVRGRVCHCMRNCCGEPGSRDKPLSIKVGWEVPTFRNDEMALFSRLLARM